MAVAMTGGDVQLAGARPEIAAIGARYPDPGGATITVNNEGIAVARNAPASIRCSLDRPSPAFPPI